jgi:hypothetical protein
MVGYKRFVVVIDDRLLESCFFFAGRANRKGAFDITQPRIVQASTGKDAAGKMCEIMWSKNGGCEKRINLK